jgi:hypothetical protein
MFTDTHLSKVHSPYTKRCRACKSMCDVHTRTARINLTRVRGAATIITLRYRALGVAPRLAARKVITAPLKRSASAHSSPLAHQAQRTRHDSRRDPSRGRKHPSRPRLGLRISPASARDGLKTFCPSALEHANPRSPSTRISRSPHDSNATRHQSSIHSRSHHVHPRSLQDRIEIASLVHTRSAPARAICRRSGSRTLRTPRVQGLRRWPRDGQASALSDAPNVTVHRRA